MKSSVLLGLISTVAIQGCNGDWMDYSPMDRYNAGVTYDESLATKYLAVAAATISSDKLDKSVTLNRMQEMVETIVTEHPDVQVITFGELILEWYYDPETTADYQWMMSEMIPGPATDFIANLAALHHVYIAFGMAERDGDKIYNTQVLMSPDGQIQTYRKRNLNDLDIENGFSAGSSFEETVIGDVRVALFICSDMQSAAISEEMTDADVDVIIQSVTSTTDMSAEISYVGMQMNTWMVFANRGGEEDDFLYTGFSHIINPAGTITDRVTGTQVYVYHNLGIYE